MLAKLTKDQMEQLPTPRLAEWFRKARGFLTEYQRSRDAGITTVSPEEENLLGESISEAAKILQERAYVKKNSKN